MTRHPVARNHPDKIKARCEWVETWLKTDMDNTKNWVFIDESAFDINMRPSTARSNRDTPVINTTPSTRTTSRTILSKACVLGVVNTEICVPLATKKVNVVWARKRKVTTVKTKISDETNTGHYTSFVEKTMSDMDKYP